MYKKISMPLTSVAKICQHIENSKNLKMFENFTKEKDLSLRSNLEIVRKESELVVYRFNDMRDWSMLNRGIFQKRLVTFNLESKLLEVKRTMSQYA
jgi:hypothetical protein